MRLLDPIVFALLSTAFSFATGSLIARSPPGSGYGGGQSNTPPARPSGDGTTNTNDTLSGTRGDSACSRSMCVSAEVRGDTVRYSLTNEIPDVGWMAIGFGRGMVGSPMVIMWANQDGTMTLSQRQATRQAEPAVVNTPPRIATVQNSLSVTAGTSQRYVFDIPANSDTTQNIIWAISSTRPSSSAVDARLVQHISEGRMVLDLSKVTGGDENDDDEPVTIPLTSNDRVLLAHATIASIGFLIILPTGSLIARYLRTFNPVWFKLHWITQFVFGGLTVVIGVVLGIVGASYNGGTHLNSTHKRLGVALLALYVAQATLGAVIHFIKPKNRTRRPPQNYLHAIVGLTIIGLALYQARTGYRTEWPQSTGRAAPSGINILWFVWVVLLPVAYGAGLFFLPKQYRQEKKRRQGSE